MSQNGQSTESSAGENVFSPLHRLQADLTREREFPFAYTRPEASDGQANRDIGAQNDSPSYDNESIYSFDSVSTSGRLLDRLDLDSEDYSDYEASLRRRESTVSFQSVGRSADLTSDDSAPTSSTDLRQIPIRANSSLGLERMRSSKSHIPARTLSQTNRMPLQAAPGYLAQQKNSRSIDSFHADFASRQNSASSLSSAGEQSPLYTQNLLLRQGNSRSHQKLPTHSPIPESVSEFSSPGKPASASSSPLSQPKTPDLPMSMPITMNRSVSSSSNESSASLDNTSLTLNSASRFDPAIDASTRKALAVRAQGNHREASYQLQTLANAPYNYPKAMYLYAKALRIGQGVKLNESHSIKWLCRCILTSYIAETSSPDSRAFTSYVSKLANLPPETLLEMVKINVASEKHDPFALMETFQNLSQSALNKIFQLNSTDKNVVGGAYYLLADSLIKGQGVPSKDEITGRLLLAKSASLAYADGMAKLGELWCGKTKHFKKDYHIASAWLRLAEFFGKQDIGNSWIYKSKYLEQKKK